jgi:hypothetical protein
MTESEWLACGDPGPMCRLLEALGLLPARKLRLAACACARLAWASLPDANRAAVEAAERYADAPEDADVPAGAEPAEWAAPAEGDWARPAEAVRWAAIGAAELAGAAGRAQALAACAGLLRDAVGNPFRPAPLGLGWPGADALALALAAYEERLLPSGRLDPARLSVLADALEEAGRADDALLDHLRGPGPHVRGCWAIDLILGRG